MTELSGKIDADRSVPRRTFRIVGPRLSDGGFFENPCYYESYMECWKWIEGYKGRYKISNKGRVCSFLLSRKIILKPVYDTTGYSGVSLSHSGHAKRIHIHRLVASAFIENPHAKPQVNHRDGIKTNNDAKNLEWVSASENCRHAVSMGLVPNPASHPRGERCGRARMTEEKVREIRSLYRRGSGGLNSIALASRYGITHSAIRYILRRDSWKHVA